MQMLAATDWEGWASDAVFRNNTFWVLGTARYGHEVKRHKDGTYELAPGWGPAQGIVFEANRYIGRNIDHPVDAAGTFVTTKTPPEMDWAGPHFDTANPDGFDDFMAAHRRWITQLMQQQFAQPLKLGR